MAHAQIGDHEIKFGIEKRKVLRVRFNEGCGLRSLPREREHCRRKIHPDDLAATAQHGFGNVALTAAQIERLETAIGAGRVQQAFDCLIGRGGKQLHVTRCACRIGPAAALHLRKGRKFAHRHANWPECV
jgi:hypothetical protein